VKRFHRSWLLLALPAALIVAQRAWSARQAEAADPPASTMRSIAVVSLTSYDKIMKDVDFIGQLSGNPGATQQVEKMIQLFTQSQGLTGLDKSKPSGLVAYTDGFQVDAYAFLPVTDLKQMLDVLAAMNVASQELGDGTYSLQMNGMPQELYVKAQGGWAFVARTAEVLANVPEDPQQQLADLDKKYDVAVRLNVQNIPEMYRQMAIDGLNNGIADSLQANPNESPEEFQARQQMVQVTSRSLEQMFKEAESLTIGWSLDTDKRNTHVDFQLAAVPGSKLAKQFAESAAVQTEFGGFVLPDSVITFTKSGKISEDEMAQMSALLDTFGQAITKRIADESPNDEVRDALQSALADTLEAFKATTAEGTRDAGAVFLTGDDTMTFAGGSHLVDSAKIEQALKNLEKLVEKEESFPGVNWNADSHEGIRFHTLQMPAPNKSMKDMFGENVDVVVGIGDDRIYFALGSEGLSTLKKAIDRSKDASVAAGLPPGEVKISTAKLFKYAAAHSNDPKIPMLAEVFAAQEGKDYVTFTVTIEGNTANYRIALQEGVLQALGQFGSMMSGGPGVQSGL